MCICFYYRKLIILLIMWIPSSETNYVDSNLRMDQNLIYNYSCVSTSDEGNVILPKVAQR